MQSQSYCLFCPTSFMLCPNLSNVTGSGKQGSQCGEDERKMAGSHKTREEENCKGGREGLLLRHKKSSYVT